MSEDMPLEMRRAFDHTVVHNKITKVVSFSDLMCNFFRNYPQKPVELMRYWQTGDIRDPMLPMALMLLPDGSEAVQNATFVVEKEKMADQTPQQTIANLIFEPTRKDVL